jgi:hypothetical protein
MSQAIVTMALIDILYFLNEHKTKKTKDFPMLFILHTMLANQ